MRSTGVLLMVGFFLWNSLTPYSSGVPVDIQANDPLQAVFYQKETLLEEESQVPRSSQGIVEDLKKLIVLHPENLEYLKYLAVEEIALGREKEAETHFLAYVQGRERSVSALLELADFYRSRNRPDQQVRILQEAVRKRMETGPRARSLQEPSAFRLAANIFQVVEEQGLSRQIRWDVLEDLRRGLPDDIRVAHWIHQELLRQNRIAELQKELSAYRLRFPAEADYSLEWEGRALVAGGRVAQAQSLLDSRFHPLWPASLLRFYYDLKKKDSGLWKEFLSALDKRLQANPTDAAAAVQMFFAYQQQGKIDWAMRLLYDFHNHRNEAAGIYPRPAASAARNWSAEELYVWGILFQQLGDTHQAARHFYGLYSLLSRDKQAAAGKIWPLPAGCIHREEALFQLFATLVQSADRPTQLGAGSMAYYRNIAVSDDSPGVLNGILSILLSRTNPVWMTQQQENKAAGYFNAARADSLYQLFRQEFPKSSHLPAMELALMKIFEQYGAREPMIRLGESFLAQHGTSPDVGQAGMLLADAYAAADRKEDCWKTYDRLLVLLARSKDGDHGVDQPSGRKVSGMAAGPENDSEGGDSTESDGREETKGRGTSMEGRQENRVVEYEQVLQRYVSSLAAAKQMVRCVTLFRRELDAHPGEAGLYERLVAFLEQNRMGAEVEEVYKRAILHFQEVRWYDRLARWYLKRKMYAEYQNLSQQVVDAFQGNDIARYLRDVVEKEPGGNRIFRQINLYANRRFPHNLVFVKNLLRSYRQSKPAMVPEWEKLARRYFFYDAEMQKQYLAHLARNRRLHSTIATVEQKAGIAQRTDMVSSDSVPLAFLAQAWIWQSRFEKSEPFLQKLASSFPRWERYAEQHVDLQRSLGSLDPEHYRQAIQTMEKLSQIHPDDSAPLIKMGEIWADAGRLDRSQEVWRRVAGLRPGTSQSTLEAATVFWDYFLPDQAEEMIARYRKSSSNPRAFFFEMGAIQESRGDRVAAIREYLHFFAGQSTGSVPSGRENGEEIKDENEILSSGPVSREREYQTSYQALSRLHQFMDRADRRELVLQEMLNPTGGVPLLSLPACLQFLSNRKEDQVIVKMVRNASGQIAASADLLRDVCRVLRERDLTEVEEGLWQERIRRAVRPGESIEANRSLMLFYERQKRIPAAMAVWERLRKDYAKNAGVLEEGVAFLQRIGQKEQAALVLEGSLASANLRYRRNFLQSLASIYDSIPDRSKAIGALERLSAIDPEDFSVLLALIPLYEKEGSRPATADLHQRLQKWWASEAAMKDQEKRARLREVWEKLASLYCRWKQAPVAVDIYIELLNRQPEDLILMEKAVGIADTFQLQQRLIDFFNRQAARSMKDHRWPFLLARIYARLGDAVQSLPYYQKALEIQPDHLGILRETIAVLTVQRQYQEALPLLRRLHRQTYRSAGPLFRSAELLAEMGRMEEALSTLEEALQAASVPSTERWARRVVFLRRCNRLAEAMQKAEEGIDYLVRNPEAGRIQPVGLEAYAESALRLRQGVRVWEKLTLAAKSMKPDDANRSTVTFFLLYGFPRTIPANAGSLQKELLEDRFRSDYQGGQLEDYTELKQGMVGLAQNGGLVYLEEQLLKMQGESDLQTTEDPLQKWNRWKRNMDDFYRRHPDPRRYAQWLDQATKTSAVPGLRIGELPKIAESYRLAGMPAEEKKILTEYRQTVSEDIHPSMMERYVDLLSTPGSSTWREDSDPGNRSGIPLVNALLWKGKHREALETVRNLQSAMGEKWAWTQQAMIGWRTGVYPESVTDAFHSRLLLQPIASRITARPDADRSWMGREWFYLAGEYVRSRYGREASKDRHLRMADLEGNPKDVGAWKRTGDLLLDAGDPAEALTFYQKALALQPGSYSYQAAENLARLKTGKREEAIAGFRQILEKQCSSEGRSSRYLEMRIKHAENVLQASLDYDFFREIEEPLRRFCLEMVRVQGTWGSRKILDTLLQRTRDETEKGNFLQAVVREAPHPPDAANYLLDSEWLSPLEKDRVTDHLDSWFSGRIQKAEEQAAGYVRAEFLAFKIRSLRRKLHDGDCPAVEKALTVWRDLSGKEVEGQSAYRLLSLELALCQKRPATAEKILLDWQRRDASGFDQHYQTITSLLRGNTSWDVSASLRELVIRSRLEQGETDPALFLELIQALYQQGKREEAHKYAGQLVLYQTVQSIANGYDSEGESPSGLPQNSWLEALAGYASESGDMDFAWECRQRAEGTLLPGDDSFAVNRYKQAEILWHRERKKEAVDKMIALLGEEGCPPETRREAAWILSRWYERQKEKGDMDGWKNLTLLTGIADEEIHSFFRMVEKKGVAQGETFSRYAVLPNRLSIEISERRAFAAEVSEAMRQAFFLAPEDHSRRVRMFEWWLEQGKRLWALKILDPTGEYDYGYIPPGRRSYDMPVEEGPEQEIGNPISRTGLPGPEAFRLTRKAFQAALQEERWETADYYARLAMFFAQNTAQTLEAAADARNLRQAREARELERSRTWKVQAVIQLPPRPETTN